MILAIIIVCLTIITMIVSIIFHPKYKLFGMNLSAFWLVPLFGAILLIIFQCIDIKTIFNGLTINTAVNPLKILCLFISMTFLSIVLDELGFFRYLAILAVERIKSNQFVLFFILYTLTSILTIFTSNDIIILTFTPFIIFFCKNEHINPIPYLISEFVAANTWSMLFIIGNPTNIYLATTFDLTFMPYFSIMWIPTLCAGISSLLILLLIFKKDLKQRIKPLEEKNEIKDKGLLIISLLSLITCIILLVISSYINIEMWKVALICALFILLVLFLHCIIRKSKNTLIQSIKRIPWSLIPFVISMFIIVLTLHYYEITAKFANMIGNNMPITTYGILSTLSCNLINNIPMSVLFADIIKLAPVNIQELAAFSTIIGSNIGAFLTPVGALAGLMWINILKEHNINFRFTTFIKYGICVVIPTLACALCGLYITTII